MPSWVAGSRPQNPLVFLNLGGRAQIGSVRRIAANRHRQKLCRNRTGRRLLANFRDRCEQTGPRQCGRLGSTTLRRTCESIPCDWVTRKLRFSDGCSTLLQRKFPCLQMYGDPSRRADARGLIQPRPLCPAGHRSHEPIRTRLAAIRCSHESLGGCSQWLTTCSLMVRNATWSTGSASGAGINREDTRKCRSTASSMASCAGAHSGPRRETAPRK